MIDTMLRGAWNHDFYMDLLMFGMNLNLELVRTILLRGEIFPIGVQYNGIKLGWFVDYTKTLW